MALWIQNITADPFVPDRHPSDYVVRINDDPPLAFFAHCRVDGAAACLRAAADATEALATLSPKEEGGE